MANVITNPHDKLFRGVMHNEQNARGFLELYMDKKDLAQLDLSTLRLKNSNFIDKHLSESISDLVYSCNYQDKALGSARVIVLVEHQSSPDKFMPFRIYHYLFNILAYELKNTDIELLPSVYGLVFYHGEQIAYPYSLRLADCFNDPHNIMEKFWNKPLPLINVHEHDDSKLLSQHIQGLMSLALKHGRDKDINDIWLQIIYAILAIDLEEQIRLQFAQQITAYLFAVGKINNKQKFITNINKLPNPIRGEMMTFADELRNEGRIEGLNKGRTEGRNEGRNEGLNEGLIKGVEKVAINALKQGLPKSMVAQLTGLSLKRINQIKQEQDL